MEKEFIRVRSARDLAVSIALTLSGIALVILPSSVSVNIAGFTLASAGILLFFTMKSAYKDKETGKRYAKKEKYFSQTQKEALSAALSSSGKEVIDIPSADNAGSLKVDFYYNTKDGSGYARIYEYVPYQYVPASPFHECPSCRMQKLLK